MLCHHQTYSKLFRWSNVWSSRLSAQCRFIGQKFRVWVTSIHHIYFPSSHLPLFVPPKGEHSSFIFRDSGWCYLSICTIFSPLLLMGKMSQNKGTKSLYILTYQASRNISAKSLQTPGLYLSVLSELLPIQEEKYWDEEGRKQQVWKMSCRSD